MRFFIYTMFGISTLVTSQLSYSGEKIQMKEYTDDGVYSFYYPSTCDVKSDRKREPGSISFRCAAPNDDSQFDTYEVTYGSGGRLYTHEDRSFGKFIADGEWYTRTVFVSPYSSHGVSWTNFKIVPLF